MDVLDDDDDFLYGGPTNDAPGTAAEASNETAPVPDSSDNNDGKDSNEDDGDDDDMEEDEDSEDDIEIITDGPVAPVAKSSIDYRSRPVAPAAKPQSASSTLTTEYKPLERDSLKKPAVIPPVPAPAPTPVPVSVPSTITAPTTTSIQKEQEKGVHSSSEEPQKPDVDPSTLPVVTAPPSAPKIELDKDGTLDGRSIYEIDIASLENKAWRRPGSDLSDWFNYGFDEISWEAYAARRRDLGEMAPVLKANVLTFSGMSEEQVLNLPGELRGMVMMSSNLAANSMGQTGGPNMIGGGAMHPDMMMNMGMMGNMPGAMPGNVGPDIGMGGQQMMMQGMNEGDGPAGVPGMMPGMDFPGGGGGMQGGMDFMQDPNSMGGTPNYPVEGGGSTPTGPSGRGTPFRGRAQPVIQRGIRGAPFRGRGRGFETAPPTGPRAASPLPPNVPTGPRNQHRYKDRDTGAPTSEPLDYGDIGGGKSDKIRDEFGRDLERSSKDDDSGKGSSRKRRLSPSDDGGRSKRR